MNTSRWLTVALGILASSASILNSQTFTFSTMAGMAGQQGTNDGVSSAARFWEPAGMALDTAGNLYVVDGNWLRKVSPAGSDWVVSTLTADQFNGYGLAADSAGSLYVADTAGDRIKRVSQTGGVWSVTFLAGGAVGGGGRDGLGAHAQFGHPYDLTVDSGTNIYVADTDNHTIRKVSPEGTNWMVTTIAGLAGASGSADGTNKNARFSGPMGITRDTAGNLYVTDYWMHTVRKIHPSGTDWVVTTLAGRADWNGATDGTNNEARFCNPRGIAADKVGNLFVADSYNNTIRKVSPVGTNWVVTTIGGLPGVSGSADGEAANALFYRPMNIAVDTAGNLYIADFRNCTIRIGRPSYSLQIGATPGGTVVCWPISARNFALETASTLSATAAWSPLTNGIAASGDWFMLTNASGPSAGFYRLHKQ
jgi:hypothetical protein